VAATAFFTVKLKSFENKTITIKRCFVIAVRASEVKSIDYKSVIGGDVIDNLWDKCFAHFARKLNNSHRKRPSTNVPNDCSKIFSSDMKEISEYIEKERKMIYGYSLSFFTIRGLNGNRTTFDSLSITFSFGFGLSMMWLHGTRTGELNPFITIVATCRTRWCRCTTYKPFTFSYARFKSLRSSKVSLAKAACRAAALRSSSKRSLRFSSTSTASSMSARALSGV
jgi:hypothetical protein